MARDLVHGPGCMSVLTPAPGFSRATQQGQHRTAIAFSSMLRRARISFTAGVMIAVVALTLQGCGTSSTATHADVAAPSPDACRLLPATEVSHLLGLPASSQAFTDLGIPVTPNTARNPTYSQCRLTAKSSQSQIRLIVNASIAKAPSLRIEALASRTQAGGRVLTIDRALAVWLPWTQQDLRGQGGTLSSTEDGDYIAVALIYVHRDPLSVAEDAMHFVLPRISTSG